MYARHDEKEGAKKNESHSKKRSNKKGNRNEFTKKIVLRIKREGNLALIIKRGVAGSDGPKILNPNLRGQ